MCGKDLAGECPSTDGAMMILVSSLAGVDAFLHREALRLRAVKSGDRKPAPHPQSTPACRRVPGAASLEEILPLMFLSGSLTAPPATAGATTGAAPALGHHPSLRGADPMRMTPRLRKMRDARTTPASRKARGRSLCSGRLWRSRRKAGGATRESWVDDRSRTGTRATTRVRHRSQAAKRPAAQHSAARSPCSRAYAAICGFSLSTPA